MLKSTLDKFQGCLVGALVGDCLGAPFEGQCWVDGELIIKDVITNVIGPDKLSKKDGGCKRYTDDTTMAKSVSASLLHCNKFDAVDMATRFTKEFMSNKFRGYGQNVIDVFHWWNSNGIDEENVLEPSANQFGGSGSYGNGGAMRVAPVALFAKSAEECIEVARGSALLTHSHSSGYVGAILQALAVFKCLHSTQQIVWKEFLQDLRRDISTLEGELQDEDEPCIKKSDVDCDNLYEWTRSNSFSYTRQLDVIEELLSTHFEKPKEDDDVLRVIDRLGRDVSAQQAVPAALYCFLRNLDVGFEETLYYSISLGGDTDTIGTMCAAMAGAYYGYGCIPPVWTKVCESHDEVLEFANQFHRLHADS